jgi:hypothetical protein
MVKTYPPRTQNGAAKVIAARDRAQAAATSGHPVKAVTALTQQYHRLEPPSSHPVRGPSTSPIKTRARCRIDPTECERVVAQRGDGQREPEHGDDEVRPEGAEPQVFRPLESGIAASTHRETVERMRPIDGGASMVTVWSVWEAPRHKPRILAAEPLLAGAG